MKQMLIRKSGVVLEALPNLQFKIRLEDGNEIRGYLSGKMRKNKINVLVGDRVVLEITSNLKISDCIARIVYRN